MEIILNELSLDGQYNDLTDFAERGLTPMTEVFKSIVTESGISVLKNTDFYNSIVYSDIRLYDIIHQVEFRRNERLRQFKSYLARFQTEPFWNIDQQHNSDFDYQLIAENHTSTKVTGHGLAEAYARDAAVISFSPSKFKSESLTVTCTDLKETKQIDNIKNQRHLLSVRYRNGEISKDEYIKKAFANRLNFEQASEKNGLNLINEDNLELFISSFEDFSTKDWQEIITDDGLDYKQFNRNRNTKNFFKSEQWDKGVWKFRIDQEKRCFGYRHGDIFYVWRIDLTHKLSDLG